MWPVHSGGHGVTNPFAPHSIPEESAQLLPHTVALSTQTSPAQQHGIADARTAPGPDGGQPGDARRPRQRRTRKGSGAGATSASSQRISDEEQQAIMAQDTLEHDARQATHQDDTEDLFNLMQLPEILPNTAEMPFLWTGSAMSVLLTGSGVRAPTGPGTTKIRRAFPGGVKFIIPLELPYRNDAQVLNTTLSEAVEGGTRVSETQHGTEEWDALWQQLKTYLPRAHPQQLPYAPCQPHGTALTNAWRRQVALNHTEHQKCFEDLKKQRSIASYRGMLITMVEVLLRRVRPEEGGGCEFPFFTSDRFATVMNILSRVAKTKCLDKGGITMSPKYFLDHKNAWSQAARLERVCSTWLLLPQDYPVGDLVYDLQYFALGTPEDKWQPVGGQESQQMRRLVAKKRAAASKAAGVPCAVKRLCWSVPTKQEWVRAMEYLCKLKFLRVSVQFWSCRQGCARPICLSRVRLTDLWPAEAGDACKGNLIDHLMILPEVCTRLNMPTPLTCIHVWSLVCM